MSLLERRRWFDEISRSIQHHPVTVLLGPRQCGKTTLARQVLISRGKRHGVEFKASDAPTMTKSIHIALADLKLRDVKIVYPGTRRYRVDPRVEVVPLADAVAWAAAL